MMSVNKAITRLANKKQMDTESLYILFVFNVRLADATHNNNVTETQPDIRTPKVLLEAVRQGDAGLSSILSERPRRFGLVFSRARLYRYVGLGTCLCSPGKGATQLIVWEKRS